MPLLHSLIGEINLLALQQVNKQRFPYLLDSAAHGTCYELNIKTKPDVNPDQEFHKKDNQLGRYSILFAYPQKTLCLDAKFQLHADWNMATDATQFLDALDDVWRTESQNIKQSENQDLTELPFRGGWFLFLAYELAQQIEPILFGADLHHEEASDLPTAFATRIPLAVIVDHELKKTSIVAEENFANEFSAVKKMINTLQESERETNTEKFLIHEENPEQYLKAIQRTQEYIHAGDIFQANLSREWKVECANAINAGEFYQYLRAANPGPFAGLAYFGKHAILSSSPERLVKRQANHVSTRPIAGTRARGSNIDDDKLLREELYKHPKERAEHIMLIDLERNDLGRICRPGSVVVDELMVIETYEHVHHIVSNVSGELSSNISPGAVLKAIFPGGTITGCPKVRCMQIIAELENKPREAYTGSMGYLNHNGDMDMNILIRTMHVHKNKLSFRAGGGIVFDSNPQKEVHETRAKAKGLISALDKARSM